jgi:hypothetical protein
MLILRAQQARGRLTNILGGFHRGLFVNLVALLFLVTAAYTLCLITIQLLVVSGAMTQSVVPAGVTAELDPATTSAAQSPLSLLNSAIALSVGVGLLLVALGLFRRARWSYPGALVVSATMAVLIILQLLNGGEANGAAVLQLLVFAAIFALFLTDPDIRRMLWERSTEDAPALAADD